MTNLVALRDQITTEFENNPNQIRFYIGDGGTRLNFGYGLNITDGGQDAVDLFSGIATAAGISEDTIDTVVDLLNGYITGGAGSPSTSLVTQLNEAFSLADYTSWIDVAGDAVDSFYTTTAVPNLAGELQNPTAYGEGTTDTITLSGLPTGVQVALEDLQYNTGGSFLQKPTSLLFADLVNLDYASAAYELAFDTATTASDTIYNKRTLVDAAMVLGLQSSINGDHIITGFTATSDADNTTIVSFIQQVATNDPTSYLALPSGNAFFSQLVGYLFNQGYYVPQPGDGTTANAIATTIITCNTIPGLNSGNLSQSVATLEAINAPFSDSSFTVGGLVHVPTAATGALGTSPTPLPALKSGENYILDTTTDQVYTAGGSTNGQYPSGALIVDASIGGSYATFDQGTYSGVALQSGNLVASLTTSDGTPVGTLSFNPSNDAGTLTLADGLTISTPSGSAINLTASSGTSDAAVLSYLSQLGVSLSSSTLASDNDAYLNPSATPTTPSGTVSMIGSQAYDTFTASTNDATVTGPTSVTIGGNSYTPTNILDVTGNMTGDTISNIQQLDIGSIGATMTAAQFASFGSDIEGGPVTIADGGTVSDVGTGVDWLIASGWEGTALSGDGALIASLLGNDTLTAGNGTGDGLFGGLGVDTLIGGTGGDDFYTAGSNAVFDPNAGSGLAAGSAIEGSGTGNTLYAVGDISGATISDIQTLNISMGNTVALTAAQFSGFSAVTLNESTTLEAVTGGTYNFGSSSTNSSSELISLVAESNSGTTLIGDGASFETLTASQSGNDTLTAGNGAHDSLVAGSGNDTLTAGNGARDFLYSGSGVDTLTGGTGGDLFEVTGDLAAGSVLQGNGTGNVLNIDAFEQTIDLSGATISDIQTLNAINASAIVNATELAGFSQIFVTGVGLGSITAATGGTYSLAGITTSGTFESVTYNSLQLIAGSESGTTLIGNNDNGQILTASAFGNDTLTAGNGNSDVLRAIGSSGTDNLNGGGGTSDWLDAEHSSGANSLTSGTGASQTLDAYYSSGNNTLSATSGASDWLNVSYSIGANNLTSGTGASQTLDVSHSSGANSLTGGSGASDWLDAEHSSGANSLTSGTGAGTTLDASYSTGGNTLTAVSGSGTGDYLNAAHSQGANTIYDDTTAGGITLDVSYSSGANNVQALTASSDWLNAENSTGNNSLTTGSGNGNTLDAGGSTGVDTIVTGNGNNDRVYAGTGVDSITTGTGTGDLVIANNGLASGSSVTANNTSSSVLQANGDISAATITGVHTIDSTTGVTLTSAQLAAFSIVEAGSILYAATGGTYNMSNGRGQTGDTMHATASTGTTLIAGNANSQKLYASASGSDTLTLGNGTSELADATSTNGNDTLTVGTGTGDVLNAGNGNDILNAGTGNDTLNANGNGYTSYKFGSSFGQDTINNLTSYVTDGSTSAKGEIDFTSSATTDEKLWFVQSGNNLLIDLLGTSDQITVDNWFGSNARADVTEIKANGLEIDTQVAQLVQAMATYAANNSGFNPAASGTTMPTDTTLQNAIAASWHH